MNITEGKVKVGIKNRPKGVRPSAPPPCITTDKKLLQDIRELFEEYAELLSMGDSGSASDYTGKMMKLLDGEML